MEYGRESESCEGGGAADPWREKGRMKHEFEIVGTFDGASAAEELVYAPLGVDFKYRATRRYALTTGGEDDGLEVAAFVREVLFDEVSQEMHAGEDPALLGYVFFIDYGMKKGALDLEKESVLRYYRGLKAPEFPLLDLKITRRIYVFRGESGSGAGEEVARRLVKDVCNPAVHTWEVTYD